jgi:hypothetical protein
LPSGSANDAIAWTPSRFTSSIVTPRAQRRDDVVDRLGDDEPRRDARTGGTRRARVQPEREAVPGADRCPVLARAERNPQPERLGVEAHGRVEIRHDDRWPAPRIISYLPPPGLAAHASPGSSTAQVFFTSG